MKLEIPLFSLACFSLWSLQYCRSQDQNSFEDQLRTFQQEIANLFKIKKYGFMDSGQIEKILEELTITNPEHRGLIDKTLCEICKLLITKIQRRTLTTKILGEAICKIYIGLSTWTVSDFCQEVIKIHLPIFEYILENSNILDPELACSVLLQNNQCYFNKPALKWTIETPPTTQRKIPSVIHDPKAKPLKILHLTDFHISPDYEIGGVENCGYPVCCKKGLGNPLFGQNSGTWGDYNCDIPPWLFTSTLAHIRETHKDIDVIYFTGDIIDHSVWRASTEDNSRIIYFTYKALFEMFPNKPIFPVIGNHESAPLNVFAPSEEGIEEANLSTQWLYTLLSKVWRPWLSTESLKTVEKQGYYSISVNRKFRIISLNNNVCYNFNWWLLYDTTFLNEQLTFLSKELQKAEENEEFVHILTHVPVGNKECIEPWEVSYDSLVKRFSHIIKGQFYGHTHTDELKVFYGENHTPINIGYNGASLTPYVKYNPNYKLMTIDPNTYDVLDINTYIFNLTDANLHPIRSPRWFKLYSMKEAYGLEKLSPENINTMARDLFKNETLFNLYWRFYVREGDASFNDGCDQKCKRETICKIFTTKSFSPERDDCT